MDRIQDDLNDGFEFLGTVPATVVDAKKYHCARILLVTTVRAIEMHAYRRWLHQDSKMQPQASDWEGIAKRSDSVEGPTLRLPLLLW